MSEVEPDQGTDLLGVTLGGKYLVEEVIGEGTMGWVYRARQFPLKREVAIKVMRPVKGESLRSVIARFTNEAEVIAQLEHPNTIILYDFGSTDDGRLFLVMKYVRGRTLRQLLDELGALPLERIVRILRQVAGSLAEAHDAGITHRDVKPANIMLTDQFGQKDVVTLLDFGVAKNADGMAITGAGQIIGTPAYMAPEIAGGSVASWASDMYSLGCVLYEMLSGAPPFGNLSAFTTVYKHVNEEPPPLPDEVVERVGVSVARLLDTMLNKQPDYRPSCAQMVEALEKALEATTQSSASRRDRLRTMQRLQAMRRRKAAHRPTGEFVTQDLQVPEGSGRSIDDLLEDELTKPVATPRRPFITAELAAINQPTQSAEVRKRPSSRSHLPMFQRPEAQGQLISSTTSCSALVKAVGMSLVEMRVPNYVADLRGGIQVKVGVPGEPVSEGLVWAEGTIIERKVTVDGVVLTVELEHRATEPYKNMVQYWSLMQRKR